MIGTAAPPALPMERARRALYHAGVIGAILQSLGNAEISGGRPIEGTSVAWLGERLDDALNRIEEALNVPASRTGMAAGG